MDYLNPRKRLRHTIILYFGYVLIGIAITIATVVLLYQAYGFGITKKGVVIQNGLIFISSQPTPADIYVNGQLQSARTNTRLALPAANYNLSLQRPGYQNWDRKIEVEGGQVAHYDYPLLVPKTIISNKLLGYDQAPALATQSLDRRWLLVTQTANFGSFDMFDLKSPAKAATSFSLPTAVLSPASGPQGWQLVEWADDNQHLLLQHSFEAKTEYILVDRQTPQQSINLTAALSSNPSRLTLIDHKYDRYYAYDAASQTLSRASLKLPTPTVVLGNVLSYKTSGTDTIVYASTIGGSAGKIRLALQVGNKGYTIRSVAPNTTYLTDVAMFNNRVYVVVGASSENRVYIYQDPADQIGSDAFRSPSPIQVLNVVAPTYLSFSLNGQFIMAENGSQLGVYDIQNKRGSNYTTKQTLDAPQTHANWMDGSRLTYVTGGKQTIFDYDYQNQRLLGRAAPNFTPMFAPDYKYSYTIAPGSGDQTTLSQTGLLIPSEL